MNPEDAAREISEYLILGYHHSTPQARVVIEAIVKRACDEAVSSAEYERQLSESFHSV